MPSLRSAHGPTVRALREAQGLRGDQIAARARISPGYLTNIEKSRRHPEQAVTAALAAALGVPVAVLTGQLPALGAIRDALGVDVATLARSVGATAQQVQNLERGTQLATAEQVTLLSTRLGVADPTALGLAILPGHALGEVAG